MLDYNAINAELEALNPQGHNNSEDLYIDESIQQKSQLQVAPWRQDPEYFKSVRISSLALVRMSTHARSGKTQEVMGVLTGKIKGDTFVVLDCYPLPVEATETRVNAMGEAYEYMVQYLETMHQVGRRENIVGWYHSHPGYGCWLSRIDVGTQMQNQAFQDPFLAIVVDPNRTVSEGSVDIGAFRTYPENYNASSSTRRTSAVSGPGVNGSKLTDYGLYADKYYPLDISYFRSPLDEPLFDLVWNRYWTNLLAENRLVTDQEFSAGKLDEIASAFQVSSRSTQDDSGVRVQTNTPHRSLRDVAKSLGQVASSNMATLMTTKARDMTVTRQ